MGHMKRLWEKQFEPTPEERAEAEAEALREKAEREEQRRAQELEWKLKHPLVWAEWERIHPFVGIRPFDFATLHTYKDYDFEWFLKEAGPAPSRNHRVRCRARSLGYCDGNLEWVERRPARPVHADHVVARELRRLRRDLRPAEPEIIGTPEVAKMAGVTTAAVRQWVESEAMPGNCIVPGSGNGTPWRFYRRRVVKWLRTR